ncbi:hypothetical protein PPACK8108_LOCUS9978 [Phakopsora pachyrhizi]|uniref:Uncharacterized protein n=1 Tax=Phakopsora pachyrhizi TaxID=170000 RepID=A0AAV0AZK9_PHAPC|nr:hypothetical protein PPACK8108_LOCUS9978 [Phakopsora pachyrhizi]
MKAGDIETLALILRPFAELPKWAYVDLGNVVEEVCEMMRAVDDNFGPSTVFKNIDPKSSSGFIVVYEELLTVLLRSSSLKTHYGPDGESVIVGAGIKKYPNLEHKLTKNATESKIKFEQQFDRATLLNITDVDIDSLVVEERNIATEEASITKRIPLKYKSLCLSEMAQHNIQHPTFQWDVKGQTRWDGLVIDILVKHWLYAKNKEAFQEYPLQSDFCTKTIVSAIVEQWLRGQKASYGKDKITNQNLSRIKEKGCETASQIIPHMNCISDTEEDEDGNLPCIESNWRHNKDSLLLHLLDTNTICSIRDRKGNNAANRCLESHRIIARNDSDQTACPGQPSNCYSEEFLNGLNATHKLSLSIQKPCVQLDQHIFSITPQHILAEANVHP